MSMPTKIGPYEILQPLGEPGLSEVYLAYDPSANRQVVIKRLKDQDLNSEELLLRFKREATILGKLENAPIVPIYEFNNFGERPCIVMRYMKGGTLGELMKGKSLPLERIVSIMERITKALDIAHQNNIIHRDLKPNNIMFDENGDAFLCDFGLSKHLDATQQLTVTYTMIGTPLYMSPEQMKDSKSVDKRSDIFSLGMILYEMLTGRHPFVTELEKSNWVMITQAILSKNFPKLTSRELEILGLTSKANRILNKTMNKNLNGRYENAGDLTKDLVRLQKTAISTNYKRAPASASRSTIARYWFARQLDKIFYQKKQIKTSLQLLCIG